MLTCKYCEVFKKTYFCRTTLVAASSLCYMNCISALHGLILYHLEDQTVSPFSKHTDYYKVF